MVPQRTYYSSSLHTVAKERVITSPGGHNEIMSCSTNIYSGSCYCSHLGGRTVYVQRTNCMNQGSPSAEANSRSDEENKHWSSEMNIILSHINPLCILTNKLFASHFNITFAHAQKPSKWPSKLVQTATIPTWSREVLSSNPGLDNGYTHWIFSCFSLTNRGKCGAEPVVRAPPLPPTSFPTH